VLAYLTDTSAAEEQKNAVPALVTVGFAALEKRLATEKETGTFCHGDAPASPTYAGAEWQTANRFKVDLTPFQISGASMTMPQARAFLEGDAPESNPTRNEPAGRGPAIRG